MATLEGTMRKLVDTENELRAHEKALLDLQQKLAQGEAVVSRSCIEEIAHIKPPCYRSIQLLSTKKK